MPYIARVLRVLIASPGDVANQRRIAREVVLGWNDVHSEDRGMVMLPVLWETHAYPAMGERPQEVINKQLVRSADVLVGIFWTRLGTPTGVAESGTVEEIEQFIESGKPTMLYFSAEPVRADSLDEEQWAALKTFRAKYRDKGLAEEVESPAEFQQKFTRQFAQLVIREFSSAGSSDGGSRDSSDLAAGVTRSSGQASVDLSSEARQLLREAARDSGGMVLNLPTLGGVHVQTNGKEFAELGNPRSEAQWRAAIEELVSLGFLEQRDLEGEVYGVTNRGYIAADQIAPSES